MCESARILNAGTNLVLHHIGSTSVIGCAAKPIIDIMVVVSSAKEYAQALVTLTTELGYLSHGPYGVEGREDFLSRYTDDFFHISVFVESSAHVANNLNFRARLNADPVARQEYINLKRALANATPNDHGSYNQGKSALVRHLLL